jgi:phosphate transport system protein
MPEHLKREINKLNKNLLSLSAAVEEQLGAAVQSVTLRDMDLARRVMNGDAAIDQREVDIEEQCLQLLALYQPVATDLRFIMAVFKINSDLERIGDLAVDIAERALMLAKHPPVPYLFDFEEMATLTQEMVRGSLDALITLDVQLARHICASDDNVDNLHRSMYGLIEDGILQDSENIQLYIMYLGISRHLERIADHATNIAEDVIYMVDGDIVRHKV